MRIDPNMKPKEPNYQVVLHALTLTSCYHAFLITTYVPVIYMHHFYATVTKHNVSYRFKIDNKRFFVNVKIFREILNVCSKIPSQEFDAPPFKEETLSFIKELGHSREIKFITDVRVDQLHQPWRTFATIINKYLSGKIDNKDSKKQDKMYYPRFTKAIIHHFLTEDKSISTYYAIATGAKKDVLPTKKPATKPKPTKKKALVKADRGKGLNVLSEVALSEAAQLKEATKQSKKDFHISHASGLGDGTVLNQGGEEDDDEDDFEDESDGDNDNNDDDGDNDDNADDSDDKRTESDRDENTNLNQSNKEHDEEEEEYADVRVHTLGEEDNAKKENEEEKDDADCDALHARTVQELHELKKILAFVDSRLDSIEQFLNSFANQPNKTNTNDYESDDGSVDIPLVSPFPHSNNDSDDEEVLNELSEYENARTLRRERIINSFDRDDLAFE
ncbi:hypothetical protein Tco_0740972, partial [Tanacetum coccineum]